MHDILETLARVVEQTITEFAARRPGCRFGLDCNADYGDVNIAVDTSPLPIQLDEFFLESARGLYAFGDWPISDLSFGNRTVTAQWRKVWSPHAAVIRDNPLDLPAFEQACRKKRLLQGACGIAADLSRRLPGIVPPILVADHDEHIRYTTARLCWAFLGPPTAAHARLTQGSWEIRDENLHQQLAFFHDQTFLNHLVVFDDPSCTITAEGDWQLTDSSLVMTMIDTNYKPLDHLRWQAISYDLLALDDHQLAYRDDAGDSSTYSKIT